MSRAVNSSARREPREWRTHTPGIGSRAPMCTAHNGAALRVSSRSGWPVHYAKLTGQRHSCVATRKGQVYEDVIAARGRKSRERERKKKSCRREGKNCSRAWLAADGPTAVTYACLTITLRSCQQPRRRGETFRARFRFARQRLARNRWTKAAQSFFSVFFFLFF